MKIMIDYFIQMKNTLFTGANLKLVLYRIKFRCIKQDSVS